MILLTIGLLLGALLHALYMQSISAPAPERVVAALRAGYRFGFDIASAACLNTGATYVELIRLEREGLIRSELEDLPPGQERPPRRAYYLTETA